MTARELWRRRVEATPGRTFLRWQGASWTFAEVDARRRALGAGLAALGVGEGTRVAVGLTNRPEAVDVQLALHGLGAVCVPLLPGLTLGELAFPLEHSRSTVLIADGPVADELLPVLGRFPALTDVVVTDEVTASPAAVTRLSALATAEAPEAPEPRGYGDRSLATVLYTSGSTGRPKGVMIGAGSLPAVGHAFSERYGITEADTWFLPTPIAHAVGALTALGIVLHTGGALALADRFSPATFWSEVERGGATAGVLFPAHLNLLLEADDGTPAPGASALRLVVTHAYLRRFRERFGVALATVWGMTETGAICAGSEPGYEGELGETYVGTAMRDAEVGIFDEAFRRLGPGEAGELCLRHPHVMLGYLDAPEETARTLVDGWVRSGDRGLMDERGRVFFAGRYKNVIKRSGENVSAEEVELALAEHPDVSECAVFGVPDRLRGEEVAAVVVVRPGSGADGAALRGATEGRLVRWKRPRYVDVREAALPRLANGKIDRVALVDGFETGRAWDADAAG